MRLEGLISLIACLMLLVLIGIGVGVLRAELGDLDPVPDSAAPPPPQR